MTVVQIGEGRLRWEWHFSDIEAEDTVTAIANAVVGGEGERFGPCGDTALDTEGGDRAP